MIGERLVALLLAAPAVAALAGDRIYPVQLPDAPTYPGLVVTQVFGGGNYDLEGDVGVENCRVQIDCYADTGQAAANDLATAVRQFLSGFRGGGDSGNACPIQCCTCINNIDMSEPSPERAGPRLRRRILEFIVWHTEV